MPTSNGKFSPGYGMLAAGAVSLLISGGALLVRGTGTINVTSPTFTLQYNGAAWQTYNGSVYTLNPVGNTVLQRNGTQLALWNATALTLEGGVTAGGAAILKETTAPSSTADAATLWSEDIGAVTYLKADAKVATTGPTAAFSAISRDGSGAECVYYNPTGDDCRIAGSTDMVTLTTTSATFPGSVTVTGLAAGAGKAACVKASGVIGYCSSAVGADGTCTCN